MYPLVVKCLLLLSAISLQTIIGCEIYHFVASDGPQALQGHVIKTISKPYVNLCWNDCVWLPWCFSINVRQTSEGSVECELSNSSKKANPKKMVTRQGWSYHEMKGVNLELCKWYECKRKEDLGNGWRRYGDAAIKLFKEKKNWTDARSHCQSLGGDLLSITSSHENDFVNDVFVENLSLTYMQEDNGIPHKVFKQYKLNGEDPNVKLLGNPGDAVYKLDGREKALYFNGEKGCAELPAIPSGSKVFSFSFWMKVLNHTQKLVSPMNIYNEVNDKIIEVAIDTPTNDMYYNIKVSQDNVVPLAKRRMFPNVWKFFTFTWFGKTRQILFGYQGYWYKDIKHYNELSEMNFSGNETWILGANKLTVLSSINKAFHGYIKHLVVSVGSGITILESQTIMHWHEQGVWIGLNDLSNTNQFSWTDGSPVKFKKLPNYKERPALSGRKCVAMAKDKKWLDKHCQLKYPFLCKKPAPP